MACNTFILQCLRLVVKAGSFIHACTLYGMVEGPDQANCIHFAVFHIKKCLLKNSNKKKYVLDLEFNTSNSKTWE